MRKTRVSPFCFEKTTIIKAESLISESVIWSGMVRPDAAARGSGEVKDGFDDRYVLRGLAYSDW